MKTAEKTPKQLSKDKKILESAINKAVKDFETKNGKDCTIKITLEYWANLVV
jgi:hypothetical protein